MSARQIVFLGCLGVLLGSPPLFAQAMPPMTAADLNGRTLRLPQDLVGAPALLLVAFEEPQQKEIDRLIPLIEKAKAVAPGLRVWELPLIDDPGAAGRFVIETGMKAGIPSEATRSRVVSLYVKDRKAFAAAIGLGEAQIVYLVALGANGRVLASKPAQEIATQQQMDAFVAAVSGKRR